jgi:hypothetical protein
MNDSKLMIESSEDKINSRSAINSWKTCQSTFTAARSSN